MKKIIVDLIESPFDIIYRLFFYFIFYFSSTFISLTYNVINSPDFAKYYRYFAFYSGNIENLNLEQGHFYFFINYLVVLIFSNTMEYLTLYEIVNFSVHFGNSLIFLVGCLGMKKYLSKYFNLNNIYLVLSILCLLPTAFELRVTLKPELLAFSCIGWLLYYINQILEENNTGINIIKFSIIFSILVTSKVSIGFMVGLFILLEVIYNKKELIKKLNIKRALIVLGLIIILLVENFVLNNRFITQVEHEEKYNNKADVEFFMNFPTEDLRDNPNKYFFSESFLGITLFDSFNDFFGFYGNSEHTFLNKDRKKFFKVVFASSELFPLKLKFDKAQKEFTFSGPYDRGWNENNYIDETRMLVSFAFSSIFYFLLFLFILFKRKLRIVLFTPFLGILIISISALGLLGTNNFDPSTADSFKSFYYSFFILFAFIILFLEIFKYNILKKTLSITLILLFLFFLGFPFAYDQANQEFLVYLNSYFPTCEFNMFVTDFLLNINLETYCDNSFESKNLISPEAEIGNINFSLYRVPYFNVLLAILFLVLLMPKVKSFNVLERI